MQKRFVRCRLNKVSFHIPQLITYTSATAHRAKTTILFDVQPIFDVYKVGRLIVPFIIIIPQ